MALYPNSFNGQFKLQPGARGERFKTSLPGYRNDNDRINRTNHRLNTNEHDTLNIKYMFDNRLPVLFTYGFAYGMNQVVIPKGRLVAVDPYRDIVDFDTLHEHNTLTIANGGAPTVLRKSGSKYKNYGGGAEKLVSSEAQNGTVANIDIEWEPLIGMTEAYSDLTYRPFKTAGPLKQLKDKSYEIDPEKGIVVDEHGKMVDVLPGNIPAGIIIRNEYTRDDDAFNGMAPGAVNTDCMVELPWFAYKDKAECNPWGSAYGGLFPGALVKSDENGRFIVSPLSYEEEVKTMTISEYELERQQVVGQVMGVSTELVPEGAARWVTWALSDRLNFEDFNPQTYPNTGRRGEDSVAHSPYKTEGKYPGYPYEEGYGAHDLHMLGANRDNYDLRMQPEYQVENLGIPGLTDGYNAVKRKYEAMEIGKIRFTKDMGETIDLYFKLPEVKVEDMRVSIGSKANEKFANIVEGAKLSVSYKGKDASDIIEVKYADELQGAFVVKVAESGDVKTFVDSVIGDAEYVDVPVFVDFSKRGLAGVPTFLDWEGVVGSVKILLQK